jgi:pimeloyl-ACP methyl ester carboxylesterase
MRLAGRILKWLGLGLLALLVAGAIYQQIGLVLDGKEVPPANDMVKVGNRAVHLECTGAGPRTFVLDAGLGAWSFEWFRIQPLLAKIGRVCAFDRAGLGWSDRSKTGYDGVAAADDLSALVDAAKLPRPFIYVGHSLGANFAEIYYARHPADIAGLVLLEPGDPKDLLEDTTQSRASVMAQSDCGALCYAAGALSFLGVPRIAAQLVVGHRMLPPAGRANYVAGLGRPIQAMTMVGESAAVPKTAYEDMDVKSFGTTPVLVFDSTLPRDPDTGETVASVKVWKLRQLAFLASLAAKSTRGVGPVHIPNSSHSTMVMGAPQAQFVAKTIAAFVAGKPR